MTTEEWRPSMVPNYEVSSLGRVRRSTPGRRTFAGKLMAAKLLRVGYYVVAPTVDGKNKTFYVHDLVAAAFIGPKPEGLHVNHIDGVKTNNQPCNLEYVSRAGNMAHASRIGLMTRGEEHPQSKLTEQTVIALRNDRAAAMSFSRLARKYGISIATAFNAAQGKTWSHVK